jgi:hypothetical protein
MSDSALHPLDRLFLSGDPLHVAIDGRMQIADAERGAITRVLLPGSFCPVHRGHWELAHAAQDALGQSVAFELSVVNVDKPTLTREEIRRRLEFFEGQAVVWLTRAPTFVEKAVLFPGAVFVVGADTALRIVLPRYYDDSEPTMHAALRRIRALGCRFLVAGRVDALGQYWRCGDLPIPAEFRGLFEEIAPERFRVDLSSSELRRLGS